MKVRRSFISIALIALLLVGGMGTAFAQKAATVIPEVVSSTGNGRGGPSARVPGWP